MVEMAPTFPCVSSNVQTSMQIGVPHLGHCIIANGIYYYRDRRIFQRSTN
jgi:hypothetical protein